MVAVDLDALEDFAELLDPLTAATDADEAGLEVADAEHEAPAWGWPSTYSQMAMPLAAVMEVVVAAKAAVARRRRVAMVRVMVAVVVEVVELGWCWSIDEG